MGQQHHPRALLLPGAWELARARAGIDLSTGWTARAAQGNTEAQRLHCSMLLWAFSS